MLTCIATLFADADPSSRIVCSSIHRAKGLERERVFVWEPGIMPMGEGIQERNLAYVAITRAKRELWLVDDERGRKRAKPAAAWLHNMR